MRAGFVLLERARTGEIHELKRDLTKPDRGGYATDALEPLPGSVSDQEGLERTPCVHILHFAASLIRRLT
ncbi:MAG: hypothetical protein AAGA68_05790 [Pseudomonadota bacterium]